MSWKAFSLLGSVGMFIDSSSKPFLFQLVEKSWAFGGAGSVRGSNPRTGTSPSLHSEKDGCLIGVSSGLSPITWISADPSGSMRVAVT